jgi:uncharacterized protein YndB with AHSA1/START domain
MKPDQQYEIWIRTTPETLWAAITEGEWTHRYFHQTRIESDWKPGSPMVMWMDDGRKAVESQVLEYDPHRRLSYTWAVRYNDELAREAPSRVTWEIEAYDGLCRLRLIHDRFPAESKVADEVAGGWMAILSNLKSVLETGEALPVS